MWNLNYNIHDLLTIRITGNKEFDLGKKLKYSFFEIEDEIENPDIVLNIGKFEPSNEDCDVIAHKYHIKNNYFYCRDKGKKVKWEVEISGFEMGKTVINFNGKNSGIKGLLFPSFLSQDFLIPLIEYKLAQKNHFLMHAGAISKNSNAHIFAGRPGAYKTTLIMDFIRKVGFSSLGDDRIIINKDKVLCFPISLFLFEFMLNNMQTEKRNIFNSINLFKNILLDAHKSNIEMGIPSKPKMLLFVSRKDINEMKIGETSLKIGIDKLILNNKAEYVNSTPKTPTGQFYKYVMVYSLLFPNNKLIGQWDALGKGLEKALNGVPMYEIKMPYDYNLNVIDEILKFDNKSTN